MNNAQKGDKILAYDNEQTAAINNNKDKIATVEQSVVTTNQKIDDLDTKLSKDYIVDYGSNENGSWEKWNSGKLVQWGTFLGTAKNLVTKMFPISFIDNDILCLTTAKYVTGVGGTARYIYTPNTTLDRVNAYVRDTESGNAPTTGDCSFSYIAVGRWK